jgi:hypothetical protein
MAVGVSSEQDDRRRGVRRTVAVLTTIAVLLYGLFFVRALLLS